MTSAELKQVWSVIEQDEPPYGQDLIHTMQEILEIAVDPGAYLRKATAKCVPLQEVMKDLSFAVHREQVIRLLSDMTEEIFPEQVKNFKKG